MPSANQSLDTILLNTGAASTSGDTLGKSVSDSNIDKKSFDAVYNKERASSDESAHAEKASNPTDKSAGVKSDGEEAETASRRSVSEEKGGSSDGSDGKDGENNGNNLPLEGSSGQEVQDRLLTELSSMTDTGLASQAHQSDRLYSELGEGADGENSLDSELTSQNEGQLATTDEPIPGLLSSKGLSLEDEEQQVEGASSDAVFAMSAQKYEPAAIPGARERETSLQKTHDSDQAKLQPALQGVPGSMVMADKKLQSTSNSTDAEASKLNEGKFEINFKAIKSADPDKQLATMDNVKGNPAVLSAASQAEPIDTVKQVTRADALALSQQLSAAQKMEVGAAQIQVPLNSPDWGQAVAQRVLMMAKAGVQAAQLQLHPRELGPVEVRISMVNEQAQVQFSSQYSVVRESLESSLARLRELFDASNVQLVDVNVSDQTPSERDTNEDKDRGQRAPSGELDGLEPLTAQSELEIRGRGLVDYYA